MIPLDFKFDLSGINDAWEEDTDPMWKPNESEYQRLKKRHKLQPVGNGPKWDRKYCFYELETCYCKLFYYYAREFLYSNVHI